MIAVGSIYYLQDRGFYQDRFGGRAICRNPWIVEAFLNGTFHAARRNPATGFWEDAVISGRPIQPWSARCATGGGRPFPFASCNSMMISG